MKSLMLVIIGGLTIAFPAQAASFDCTKAKSRMEQAICNDADLSKTDEVMGALYKDVLKALENDPEAKKRVKRQQKEWLKKVTDQCGEKMSPDCLKSWYEIRIGELGNEFPESRDDGEAAVPLDDAVAVGPGVYNLELGQGFGLCEELFKRLKEQQSKNTGQDTEICELNVLRSIPGVQFPFAEWKKLDYKGNELLYIKLLLLGMIKQEHYTEVVEKYLPKTAEKIGSISIPFYYMKPMGIADLYMPKRQGGEKDPLKGVELIQAWRDAIAEGYSLYLGDASDIKSKETGPLLIEAKGIDRSGCPRVRRVARLPSDLGKAKMLEDGGMLDRQPTEVVNFMFNKRTYTFNWAIITMKSVSRTLTKIVSDSNERCLISIY